MIFQVWGSWGPLTSITLWLLSCSLSSQKLANNDQKTFQSLLEWWLWSSPPLALTCSCKITWENPFHMWVKSVKWPITHDLRPSLIPIHHHLLYLEFLLQFPLVPYFLSEFDWEWLNFVILKKSWKSYRFYGEFWTRRKSCFENMAKFSSIEKSKQKKLNDTSWANFFKFQPAWRLESFNR